MVELSFLTKEEPAIKSIWSLFNIYYSLGIWIILGLTFYIFCLKIRWHVIELDDISFLDEWALSEIVRIYYFFIRKK